MNLNAYVEKIFAGRWIAGYYLQDALDRTKTFNSKGISTIINFLGEDIRDEEKTKNSVEKYIDLIDGIKKQKLRASISIKLTQIGLLINYKKAFSNYVKIARYAKSSRIFVWLDMEGPENVDAAIKMYESALQYGNVGICIQSYLKRSETDVEDLVKKKAVIRLVKGAYKIKSEGIVFKSRRAVNSNYMRIMRFLFLKSRRFMIATHDSRIIEEAIKLNKKQRKDVTFAMLNGIRNRYAVHLAKSGQKVSAYVPFGSEWLDYGLRRITEERHLMLIIRSLFEKQGL